MPRKIEECYETDKVSLPDTMSENDMRDMQRRGVKPEDLMYAPDRTAYETFLASNTV